VAQVIWTEPALSESEHSLEDVCLRRDILGDLLGIVAGVVSDEVMDISKIGGLV